MNATDRPLRVAIVAGEESGDLLGADLVKALGVLSGRQIELVGVGGRHLEGLGLKSLFEASEIALMGISAVIRDLPRLIGRISSSAKAIVEAKPDCLITIDVPDFSLRVSRKVKARLPNLPTIHYVCPSVWAWRPGRARAMRDHVDHVLCLLPFEPAELERLDGPRGTYVGHRLSQHPQLLDARAAQKMRQDDGARPRRLLVLPGSRRSEVNRLIGPFGDAVRLLAEQGETFEVMIPTLPRLAPAIREATSHWAVTPKITEDEASKWEAFARADSAIAASGTVLLELSLARVPMISCYQLDRIGSMLVGSMISGWSGALPNLIAGWPFVAEQYNEWLRPAYVARLTRELWRDTPVRAVHLDAFDRIEAIMSTAEGSGMISARVVLAEIEGKGA